MLGRVEEGETVVQMYFMSKTLFSTEKKGEKMGERWEGGRKGGRMEGEKEKEGNNLNDSNSDG